MQRLFDKVKVFKPEIRENEADFDTLVSALKHWTRKGKTERMIESKESLINFLNENYSGSKH